MKNNTPIRAIAFDAYGTLFDVYSVGALAEQLFPGKGGALTALWRLKQIEYSFLRTLSGREHQVITAVAIALRDQVESQISVSSVWFRELADAEIRRYVTSGEPGDKAGAYAIQGRAGAFVTRISGSYSGIMGLPLAETAELLARFNVSMV